MWGERNCWFRRSAWCTTGSPELVGAVRPGALTPRCIPSTTSKGEGLLFRPKNDRSSYVIVKRFSRVAALVPEGGVEASSERAQPQRILTKRIENDWLVFCLSLRLDQINRNFNEFSSSRAPQKCTNAAAVSACCVTLSSFTQSALNVPRSDGCSASFQLPMP